MPSQVVAARIRGFICLNAHPAGCAANVDAEIATATAGAPGTARLGPRPGVQCTFDAYIGCHGDDGRGPTTLRGHRPWERGTSLTS